MDSIKDLRNLYILDLKEIKTGTKDINSIYIKYLGKKGELNKLFQIAQEYAPNDKIAFLKSVNELKTEIEEQLNQLKENPIKISKHIDLTIPVTPTKTGNLHPLTLVKRDLYQFFHYYGFSVYDGPEIETDYYNFELMGVPANHPARELQDTLYLLEPEILLRTQTSNIEARILESKKPPIRFVIGDAVYRNETDSRTNGSFFHQFQGVYVDRNVTMGNLKWLFTKSLQHILGNDTIIRFRAKYYPEVEPGMSPDVQCKFCKGEGCEVCKYRGWIEIAGGGMIHPNTLTKTGIDPKQYSGLAFGWGLDRIVMQKYQIKDLRVLYNGSLIYD